MKWHSILKNAEKQLRELPLFESETMVAKIQFEVDMSIKALFPDDQGEVKKILREKNENIEKQLKQRRQIKWMKFIDRRSYGYYVPNDNPGEKSVIDPTKMIDRIQPVNDIKRELHKNITVRRGKKKSYAEIVRGCSSKNNEGLISSEELVSMDNLDKNSIYAMEINNGVGNIGLSEHHKEFIKVHENTVLETGCDGNMTKLQSFNEQEPRIKNTECEEITSEEGKDAVITGLFRENFEHNLTRSDEDLVDILVDLGKKNSILSIDITEGLNVSNEGDKFTKLVPPETDQIKTAVFNDSSMSKKNSEAIGSFTEDGRLKGFFCSKTAFNLSKKILTEAEIKKC